MARPGRDDLPFVFSGTLVVQGFGFAEVKAVGIESEIGKIGKALKSSGMNKQCCKRKFQKWCVSLHFLDCPYAL